MASGNKGLFSLLILLLAFACATSSRILDEVVAPVLPPEDTGAEPVGTAPGSVGSTSPAGTAAPGGAAGASVGAGALGGAAGASVGAGAAGGAAVGAGAAGGAAVSTGASGGAAGASAGGAADTLTFFMHDILGGSNPSAIAVTGLVTNPAVGGQVPFAKPNGAVLPVNNGVPVNNANSGVINNNNIPFLTGLSGMTPNLVQQNGNSIIGGGFGFPALNVGQFPSGITFQKLMFGTMTVFDDELTEGQQHGSGLVGKAQGFYIVSSEDGTSQTMAFTVMFASGSYADSLSFFGVHRTAVSESHLAIMGGTGKYVNAKGFATIKTFPAATNQVPVTDGVETVLEFTVYLAY
ncbi:OLC1v1004182C1 [Oldenlandia corymbosa var. corymbosa]|uniref:Dirigent protein n=1 Tax=Oldenlandia corymbosa var. corymbosa TaxID=529605 RepID=A0AAV1DBY6_OLDCO|nr:OLC1v1004182C1 [Oldenlandia corymbosa var. corymbosa]